MSKLDKKSKKLISNIVATIVSICFFGFLFLKALFARVWELSFEAMFSPSNVLPVLYGFIIIAIVAVPLIIIWNKATETSEKEEKKLDDAERSK